MAVSMLCFAASVREQLGSLCDRPKGYAFSSVCMLKLLYVGVVFLESFLPLYSKCFLVNMYICMHG